MNGMRRIDAHQHFWRYAPADFPWMDDAMGVLRRDWMPPELQPLLEAQRFDASIAVQARSCTEETDFLLGLAETHPWIAAVVGWVDLRADDLAAQLDGWSDRSCLAGFRHLLQDEADMAAVLANPRFHRGVAAVQERGKVYEVLLRAPQLHHAADFCGRHDRHALVLDHLGKPAIGGEDDAAWRTALAAVAAHEHVYCKVSGLVTEVVGKAIDADELRRYLDAALDAFGSRRLMFGSDWPVCLLRADYDQVHAIVADWAASLSLHEQAALFGGNAARCYGLVQSGLPSAADEPRP